MATLVFAATNALGSVSGSVEVVVGGAPTFPTEYSLTRPLLANNPGALVTGEDWQNMHSNQDVWDLGFFFHVIGTDLAATQSVLLATNDPTFTKAIQCFQKDKSTSLKPITVQSRRSFAGISKAWYRFTMKFQNGFTLLGPGGGASAWKFMFGGTQRHWVWTGGTNGGYVEHFNRYGGPAEVLLPNSDVNLGNANPALGNTEWTDEEWWEFIVYEERVSSTHYRVRYWRRELTANGVITGPTSTATWDRLYGMETTNGTVPAGDSDQIQLGINRNKPMFAGTEQYWFWGPWEVLNGDVVADPYGIESQIR